jgi:hypothetical protein
LYSSEDVATTQTQKLMVKPVKQRGGVALCSKFTDSWYASRARDVGFLDESRRILAESGDGDEQMPSRADSLLESAAESLSEIANTAHTGGFPEVVQLVNTLFEVAAAAATLGRGRTNAERRKIKQLLAHATRGLKMIGAEEALQELHC